MAKKKVLLVEDDTITAQSSKLLIEKDGYEVVATASTGKDAVELAVKHEPDVIIMDIQLLGKMSGIEATIEIQKYLDVPIVFTTGYPEELTKNLNRLNPCSFVSKPFSSKALKTAITMASYYHDKE